MKSSRSYELLFLSGLIIVILILMFGIWLPIFNREPFKNETQKSNELQLDRSPIGANQRLDRSPIGANQRLDRSPIGANQRLDPLERLKKVRNYVTSRNGEF